MEEERRHEITTLQINMAEIQKDISFIKDSITEDKKAHKEIIEKIDSFIETADKKYADKNDLKLLQKIVFGMIGAVCITVLYAILSRVIK